MARKSAPITSPTEALIRAKILLDELWGLPDDVSIDALNVVARLAADAEMKKRTAVWKEYQQDHPAPAEPGV